jgi:methionine salvage enolase-phosphatase E1
VRLLGLQPAEIALVAAHSDDLAAAAACGLRTIFVRRSTEDVEKRDGIRTKAEGGEVDLVVDDLKELARVLDAGQT